MMPDSRVGWLLVLGRWSWMPPMGLAIQVKHRAGKSRGKRVVRLETPPGAMSSPTPGSPQTHLALWGTASGGGGTYWPWFPVNHDGSSGDGSGLGACSDGGGDVAVLAPAFLPAPCCPSGPAWVLRGPCSPRETSDIVWPTTSKP